MAEPSNWQGNIKLRRDSRKLANTKKNESRRLFVAFLITLLAFSTSMVALPQLVNAQGITRVQGPIYSESNGSGASGLSATFNSVPVQGDLLIAVVGLDSESATQHYTVSSVTQTGVTWTLQVNSTFTMGGVYAFGDIEIWAGVVRSDADKTVNAVFTGDTIWGAAMVVCEYSGLANTNFLDQTNINNGFSASPNTGSTSTTSQADELWIGGIVMDYTSQSVPTNGFTLLGGTKYGECSYSYLEKIVSSTGSANAGDSGSGPWDWAGCIATFATTPLPTPTPTPTPSSSGIPIVTPMPTQPVIHYPTATPTQTSDPNPTPTPTIKPMANGTGYSALSLLLPLIIVAAGIIVLLVLMISIMKRRRS